VANEVQARAIDAGDAIAPRAETAAVTSDALIEHLERRPISRREDHRVERSFRPIDKSHTSIRELGDTGGELNRALPDCIGKVKADQWHCRARRSRSRRKWRSAANRLRDHAGDRHDAQKHGPG